MVNETFVKRFFKTNEDPLDQHFGIDLPENAGTFRIVGIVRDAKFAGFALQPSGATHVLRAARTRRQLQAPAAAKIELRSHFISGIMLVTNATPGALEPLLTRVLAEVDPNLTITSVRTMQSKSISLSMKSAQSPASPDCSGSWLCCWPRLDCTESLPTPWRSERRKSASAWRSAQTA